MTTTLSFTRMKEVSNLIMVTEMKYCWNVFVCVVGCDKWL